MPRISAVLLAGAIAALAIFPAGGALAGDPLEGERVFKSCGTCHTTTEEINMSGPHLVGIYNRPVAAVEGFSYSTPMREAGARGMVWDETNLTNYLRDPNRFMPGNRMFHYGIRRTQRIEDLIAYFRSLQEPQ